jgi:hypothetical protein
MQSKKLNKGEDISSPTERSYIVLTRILHMIFFVFIFSAGARRYRSRVKVPGTGS